MCYCFPLKTKFFFFHFYIKFRFTRLLVSEIGILCSRVTFLQCRMMLFLELKWISQMWRRFRLSDWRFLTFECFRCNYFGFFWTVVSFVVFTAPFLSAYFSTRDVVVTSAFARLMLDFAGCPVMDLRVDSAGVKLARPSLTAELGSFDGVMVSWQGGGRRRRSRFPGLIDGRVVVLVKVRRFDQCLLLFTTHRFPPSSSSVTEGDEERREKPLRARAVQAPWWWWWSDFTFFTCLILLPGIFCPRVFAPCERLTS